jgi:carbamoyl-phosphate synthase large subunit
MEICHDETSLANYMRYAVKASPEHPVLVDRFLADATEVDVDCIADGTRVVIGGVMEHIEEAGVHSGDSACSLPPYSLRPDVVDEIIASTRKLAVELGVRGLMNVQYAIKDRDVYVLEVNPRASRTVPFVSKAIGVPLAKLAALVMAGKPLDELGFTQEIWPKHFSVKEAVFPFVKFPGVDTVLGPEMKSTGEVMGIDSDFGRAYAKAQIEAGNSIPKGGRALISLRARRATSRRSACASRSRPRWGRASPTSCSASRAARSTSCSTPSRRSRRPCATPSPSGARR